MKRFIIGSLLVLAFASMVFALDADIEQHPSCTYCGMDRATYAHSRIVIAYDDGTTFGACSLHCAAVDLAKNIDKTPMTVGVGDYYSKKLIDAEKAFWVVGGNKPGVMTVNAKWAFEDQRAAEKFIKENGGSLVTFDAAMEAAYADMYKDTKKIRERRKMKRSPKPKGQS